MDMSFADQALAEVCNSQEHLNRVWGPDLGKAIGRRLLDMAACSIEALNRLPGTTVRFGEQGATTITLAGQVDVHGFITVGRRTHRGPGRGDHLTITSLTVHRSSR